MRLFCAIDLPDVTRQAIAAAGDRIRPPLERLGLDARWTPVDNLHVTLWFFGEQDDAAAEALAAGLSRPLVAPPFGIALGGAGVFPASGPPRVLWVGVREGADGIRALHGTLAARLQDLGCPPEARPFHPHVTLARMRGRPSAGVGRSLRGVRIELGGPGRCEVDALTLYRSRLSPRGARYDPVLRVPLKR